MILTEGWSLNKGVLSEKFHCVRLIITSLFLILSCASLRMIFPFKAVLHTSTPQRLTSEVEVVVIIIIIIYSFFLLIHTGTTLWM
jgi:hypothetical protein